ncbi:ThiF family adenylyltransferase [Porphyromonas sp. COT-239 OH1446]|uniref:tRNA threonylcarbamoyladenosine dehydratase n=1 Tax=Porphyromonas sp. COT-239 OH1446 TaxID=1515613 RepID=UPI00052CD472|nr:tRNA threonylcarbamoyladenosine dehydratase [Porphyromonas sp. COT-239 OH1446]KGN70172.1 MoeB [Porphyromonas sp. COT-239 OH1446]
MIDHNNHWCERTRLLYGSPRMQRLAESHVLVVGLGGVGGACAEMLARAGIGRMTLVDADIVQPSNINRQIVALHSTVGRAKASVLAERLRDINPEIHLEIIEEFMKDDNLVALVDAHHYDFVVDAIDSLSPKVHLIALSLERGFPIISSMGAGAKQDPASVQLGDLSKSYNCTLARVLRKRLRKMGIRSGLPVVFSTELPDEEAVVEISGEQCKRSTAGTVSYMPMIFGCHLAAYVLRHLADGATYPSVEDKS